jgi:two-component system cell cycle response regulator
VTSRRESETVVTSLSQVGVPKDKKDSCIIVIYGPHLGKRFNVNKPEQLIGRSELCEINIDQESISRKHAKICNENNSVTITDLQSTNGTYVNHEQVGTIELRDGDYIKIGRTIFKYLSSANIESDYHEEIYRLTTIDGLTQTYNKRYFMDSLEREINRCERYQRYLSLCIFDIDKFKNINDKYGHLAGDSILRDLAYLIANRIRREDIFARYGGEEFAIILPEVNSEGAYILAEKLRSLIAGHQFLFEGKEIEVTVSFGVTTLFGTRMLKNELIRQADDMLYQAKDNGRNRTEVFKDNNTS